MLMSSSVASCSTSCQKGSAASGTSDSWRTPAAAPSFQSSALLCKRRSRDPLLNPPIIASATQSSPVIVSICAQSVVAAWSRWAFRRARHLGDAQHRAVTPHDDQPRTPALCASLRASPCRCLPVGTSSHARKTSRACSHRLSAAKTHAMVLAYAIARSVLHHSLLMAQPYGRTIHYRTAGGDLERP